MPRTDRMVRRSRLMCSLIVLFFFPFFWLMCYGALLLGLVLILTTFRESVPSLERASRLVSDLIRIGLPAVLAVIVSRVLYHDLRRQPITPDGRYCAHCGYDLTGNVTGTCPECGDAV